MSCEIVKQLFTQFLAGMRGRGAAAAPAVDGTGYQDVRQEMLWS